MIKRLITKHWSDPVWSKVISAVILAILGSIGTLLIWLLKNVSFGAMWNFLSGKISVPIWVLFLVLFLFFILIFKPIVNLLLKIEKTSEVNLKLDFSKNNLITGKPLHITDIPSGPLVAQFSVKGYGLDGEKIIFQIKSSKGVHASQPWEIRDEVIVFNSQIGNNIDAQDCVLQIEAQNQNITKGRLKISFKQF